MVRVAQYIEDNIKVVKEFIKLGKMPLSIMSDYDMYKMYLSITDEKAPMKKYKRVAETCKVSTMTVIRAIKNMEKVIAS